MFVRGPGPPQRYSGPFCYLWTGRISMTSLRLLLFWFLLTTPAFAQKTPDMIRELQRDLATLQQDVKTLNSKFDERIAVMSTLLQQALDESKGANRGVAVVDRQLKDNIKELQNAVTGPVAV